MGINKKKIDEFNKWFKDITNLHLASLNKEHINSAKFLYEYSIPFLEKLIIEKKYKVLDVGCGYGYHCNWFSARSKYTYGITDYISDTLKEEAIRNNFNIECMDMHDLKFPDNEFDILWSHHSLEHSFSPLYALREWWRVLKVGGQLAVTVPPYYERTVSGHFTTGWHIGQLMYLLLISGFDVKNGYFVQEGYNVRAIVTKKASMDFTGQAYLKNVKHLFPAVLKDQIQIAPKSLGGLVIDGNIKEIDGKNNTIAIRKQPEKKSLIRRGFQCLKRKTKYL